MTERRSIEQIIADAETQAAREREKVELLRWASAMIHDEWSGTSDGSEGNRWLARYDALYPVQPEVEET